MPVTYLAQAHGMIRQVLVLSFTHVLHATCCGGVAPIWVAMRPISGFEGVRSRCPFYCFLFVVVDDDDDDVVVVVFVVVCR